MIFTHTHLVGAGVDDSSWVNTYIYFIFKYILIIFD